MPSDVVDIRNRILRRLPAEELEAIRPHLVPVELKLREKLAVPQHDIEHVYFPEGGIVSTVSGVRGDVPVEIGITGREGVGNLQALLGIDRVLNETNVQVPHRALRLGIGIAREAMERGPALNLLVRRYAHVFMVQITSTVVANTRGTVSQRLARWLLMARDRVDDDAIPLTHEFLSFMLGVRRPGVTTAMGEFERRGWVGQTRGVIILLDKAALLAEAGAFYGAAEAEEARLFA